MKLRGLHALGPVHPDHPFVANSPHLVHNRADFVRFEVTSSTKDKDSVERWGLKDDGLSGTNWVEVSVGDIDSNPRLKTRYWEWLAQERQLAASPQDDDLISSDDEC